MENIMCNCNRTCHLIVSTSIELNGTTSLRIEIPGTTFNNGETFGLYLAGNYVMSDQLRSKRLYTVRAGSNPAHFVIRCPNALFGTAFVAPQIVPATAETTGA